MPEDLSARSCQEQKNEEVEYNVNKTAYDF